MVAMRIGIIGAGNIGQMLKAMLASVEDVTEITLADNGQGDVHVDPGTGDNLVPSYVARCTSTRCPSTSIRPWLPLVPRHADPTSISQRTSNPPLFVSWISRATTRRSCSLRSAGLAPDAINIIGAHLVAPFDAVRSLELGSAHCRSGEQRDKILPFLVIKRARQRIH